MSHQSDTDTKAGPDGRSHALPNHPEERSMCLFDIHRSIDRKDGVMTRQSTVSVSE